MVIQQLNAPKEKPPEARLGFAPSLVLDHAPAAVFAGLTRTLNLTSEAAGPSVDVLWSQMVLAQKSEAIRRLHEQWPPIGEFGYAISGIVLPALPKGPVTKVTHD